MPKPKPKKVGRPKLAKGDAKAVMLRVRICPGDLKRVEKLAKAENRSVSELTRILLAPAVETYDTVSMEGEDGVWVVMGGWPGKPIYSIQRDGEPSTQKWVNATKLTLVKKMEIHGDFQQYWP